MKLVVEDSTMLARALARVSRAPDEGHRGGVGARVRMSADRNRVELLARDDVVAAITETAASVSDQGGCCVPIKLLVSVLESAPPGELLIERSGDDVEFVAPNWRRTLRATERDYLPDFPVWPSTVSPVPAAALRRLLQRTSHAADASMDRPDRSCVVLSASNGVMEAFASDGFRAAHAKADVDFAGRPHMVVHQHALRELQYILDFEPTVDVLIGFSATHMFLRTPSVSIAALEPHIARNDLSGLFDQPCVSSCTVPSASIAAALDSSYETTGSAEVRLAMSADCLTMTTEDSERGTTKDVVPALRTGPALEVSVNNRFLREALRAIDEEEVTIGGSGGQSPVTVRPSGQHDAEVVIMAMQRHL